MQPYYSYVRSAVPIRMVMDTLVFCTSKQSEWLAEIAGSCLQQVKGAFNRN